MSEAQTTLRSTTKTQILSPFSLNLKYIKSQNQVKVNSNRKKLSREPTILKEGEERSINTTLKIVNAASTRQSNNISNA